MAHAHDNTKERPFSHLTPDLGLLPVKNIDLPLKVTRQTKKKRTRQHKKILSASIEERSAHIDKRQEFGHWEIDTVLGNRKKGAALLTHTDGTEDP